MANEFIIRKGFISLTDSQITGSLNVTAGITGSLLGTASFATTALSASYFSGSVVSSSYASASTSASYALSSSYALNGGVTQILAGSNVTLSPSNGLGQVTIIASLSGSTNYNTSTGSYGSFYDTGSVAATSATFSTGLGALTGGIAVSSILQAKSPIANVSPSFAI